jgi:predicted metal-dependent peptidase
MTTTTKQAIEDLGRIKAKAVKFNYVQLTPAQDKAWTETRAALLWGCPAFSHILYTMMSGSAGNDKAFFTKDIPIAATDGVNLFLNPDTFFKYTLHERVFAIAHEIAHCMFNHCGQGLMFRLRGKVSFPNGKSLPYDGEIMNTAQDLVINDMLIQSNIGKFNKDWLHDTAIATGKDSAIDTYAKVFKQCKGGGGGGKGPGGGKRFDLHLDPGQGEGKDPQTASNDRNEAEWGMAIAAAAQSAKAQGKLPAALERFLGELLEPRVDWQDKIRALFARRLGNDAYDWRKLDRRLIVRGIGAPGRKGFGAECVVVAVDTSGSIGNDVINRFMGELSGILEDVRPREVRLVWCDAKVHRVDELDEMSDLNVIRAKGAPGGGGTSFEPVFEWITAEGIPQVDALVYLTDMYGSFPAERPSYPVIWGSISKGVGAPFGDIVEIPV